MRRSSALSILALLAASVLFVAGAAQASAEDESGQREDKSDQKTVKVDGVLLAGITTSPLTLTPAFSPTITDYVLRCQAGENSVELALSARPGGQIKVGASRGKTVIVKKALAENEALIVSASALGPRTRDSTVHEIGEGGRVDYWIRCLPHDFPQLEVSRPGTPPPGWYLTGSVFSSGNGTYAMVLDSYGVPVWYRSVPLGPAQDVTALPGNRIAWLYKAGPGFSIYSDAAFETYDLNSGLSGSISAPMPPTDGHELLRLPNGNFILLATPLRPDMDLTALGLDTSRTIVDCVIQEVDPSGRLVWMWRASDHISPTESMHPSTATVFRQFVYDIFHCNSVDVDPESGNLLLSVRHADAIYLIEKLKGRVIWRLGGTSPNLDGGRILKITGDPNGTFHAQHDARFTAGGDVSVYDNQSWNSLVAARAVEYHINPQTGVATLAWAYISPDGLNSAATGSFRRLNGGNDNVIGWGFKPNSLFTEVDAAGQVLLDVKFRPGQAAYRVSKVREAALDIRLLRRRAGVLPSIAWPVPAVAFVGPGIGPAQGGTTVAIIGSFSPGAVDVRFGPAAAKFTVVDASTIIAIAPPGLGQVTITVRTPGGTSATFPINQLAATFSDSSFENGIGSWSASDGDVLSSTTYARTGLHSLRVSPANGDGGVSSSTGQYSIPEGAKVTGRTWVFTPQGPDHIRATLTFYDAFGRPTTAHNEPLHTSTTQWTEVTAVGIAPQGSVSVAIGIRDESASGPIYIDDAALTGTNQYSYLDSDSGLM